MTPLTVCCVWVQANVPYGVEYVANLRAMVARHLARPHRFVCLTDCPTHLPPDVDASAVSLQRGVFGWWAKIALFEPDRWRGRVLYLDLDTLIVSALDPIVDFPSSFALVPHAGTFTGAYKGTRRQVVPRYNSSVMVWDAGVNTVLSTSWQVEVTERLHGDQDFIGQVCPNADTMPGNWFPRLSELHGQPPGPHAKVVLAKKPKNALAAQQLPWVADVWRAA